VIEEVEDHKVPFVLLRTHSGLASAAGVPDLSSLDDVAFEVRHYRLYEWVYENFEPFAAVQRWQVWIRKDRLLENPPEATDERTIFAWDETGVQFDGQRQASPLAVRIGAGTEPSLGPRVMIDPAKTYFLRIAGRSDVETKLTIAWSTRTSDGSSRVERRVAWKPGPGERYLFVPGEHSMRALDEISIEWDAGFEPKRFELVEAHSHECQIVNRRVHGNLVLELGDLPYLWGSCDPDREPGAVLRELDGPELAPTTLQVFVDFATDETMRNGIHAHVAAFRQGDDGVNAPARIQVGDRLAFAKSGVRTVVDVKDRDVYLDGAPLDPDGDGAPNRVRLAAPIPPEKAEYPGLLPAGQPRYFRFEPLPSRAGGTYLILRARSLDDHEDRLVVDFGRGEEIAGRFVLKLQPDREMREYAVRLTMEYNWFHRDCDWITVLSESSPVEIESARLVQGD
jgi:hypothetical protein